MVEVDTSELVDARGVAELLGLSHPNSVSTYQHRYQDMPRPVVDLGVGRCKLWLQRDVVAWAVSTGRMPRSSVDARSQRVVKRELEGDAG